MFSRKRPNTLVRTIEAQYGIDLNARGDMLLGNLLKERGFDSLSQLRTAYRGRATTITRTRRIFISFHAGDKRRVNGFRRLLNNPRRKLNITDESLKAPIKSERKQYLRQQIYPMIRRSSVVVCIIGNGTGHREWVDWELEIARQLRKGLCGVRLNGSYGRFPRVLKDIKAPIAKYDVKEIVAAIQRAAAIRR